MQEPTTTGAHRNELALSWSHTVGRPELARTLSQCSGFSFGREAASAASLSECERPGDSSGWTAPADALITVATGRSVFRLGSQPLPLPARGSGGGGPGGPAAWCTRPFSFAGGIGGGGGGGGAGAPSGVRLPPVPWSRMDFELDGAFILDCWNCLGSGGIGRSSGELVLETVAVEPRPCWSPS
jgi:hypothetical protein